MQVIFIVSLTSKIICKPLYKVYYEERLGDHGILLYGMLIERKINLNSKDYSKTRLPHYIGEFEIFTCNGYTSEKCHNLTFYVDIIDLIQIKDSSRVPD